MLSPSLYRRAAMAAFIAAVALVLFMALKPPGGPGLGIWDKAQHFIAFYTLMALGSAAFARRRLWPVAVGLFLLGGGIELLQATPLIHRDAELGDLVADTIGISAVLGPMVLPRFRAWLVG